MPSWLKDAIFYEIYPQTFKDSNGDGIGDFRGILEKLDYIKSLGCNAIWLNPCYESPFLDAGYDISDHKKTAERYGSVEELSNLFYEIHQRDMHIILDLVPGHTSMEHDWFTYSCEAEKNPFSDRYIWTDSVWESPEGMNCIRGMCERNGSCAVNFFTHQPALNYGFAKQDRPWKMKPDDPAPMETRSAIKHIMRFWLDKGCDGFRVDMAGTLIKDDPDGSANIALWQDFREFLDLEYPEAAIISEWGEPDKAIAGGFHMDFLLHFGPSHYNDLFRCEEPFFSRRGKGSAEEFVKTYTEYRSKASDNGYICIPSGNHDMDRLRRRLDMNEMKIAFTFLLTMPGVPYIYYGDEIGMRYIDGLPSKEGGYERTGSRTPMQWDDSPNAGFSDAEEDKLYLPLDPRADRPTAEGQLLSKESLMREVKKLTALRHEHSALQADGKIKFVSANYPLVYFRTDEKEQLLVLINPSRRKYSLPFNKEHTIIYNVGKGRPEKKDDKLIMPPETASILKLT